MKINAAFDKRVVIHSDNIDWIESPMVGVFRRPLDRVGGEVARATSIVRYEPGSQFSPHVHTGGEEFVVLEGVFQDEHGDFPVGSYIRNPPESSHTPGSNDGCVIFVKLWQFDLADRTEVKILPNSLKSSVDINQSSITPLHLDNKEEVSFHQWKPNTNIEIAAKDGIEILVLDGSFVEQGDILKKHSWLRLPINSTLKVTVGDNGAKVWIKQHHLNRVASEIDRINVMNSLNS